MFSPPGLAWTVWAPLGGRLPPIWQSSNNSDGFRSIVAMRDDALATHLR